MRYSDFVFFGVCGSMVCSGVAMLNNLSDREVCGWLLVGFVIGVFTPIFLATFND